MQDFVSEYVVPRGSDYPRFAVVGHPNKGKSSIVSSLALDSTVQISDIPGTTVKTRSFPLKVDNKILYELYDTPGFQRARRVLAWLKSHDVSADKRPDVIRRFIREHRDDPMYLDEIELLMPIVDGAVIIYVVDGSKPYSSEYEAEMEILRWSGQPSMALVNMIGSSDYADEWHRALEQYFKLVRSFDPMCRDLHSHISLLEGIAQLRQEWIEPFRVVIDEFIRFHDRMMRGTARSIARMIYDSLSHIESIPIEASVEQLESRYRQYIRKQEHKSQKKVERIWNHAHMEVEQSELELDGIDLFSRQSASIFGLTRKELIYTGMAGGAATGAGVDVVLGGSTLMIGSVVGALAGGAGAYLSFDKIAQTRVMGIKLGSQRREMGPMSHRNLPFVLLGRAIYHAYNMATRSHAVRGGIDLHSSREFRDLWLDDKLRRRLDVLHREFASRQTPKPQYLIEYEDLVYGTLAKIIKDQNC